MSVTSVVYMVVGVLVKRELFWEAAEEVARCSSGHVNLQVPRPKYCAECGGRMESHKQYKPTVAFSQWVQEFFLDEDAEKVWWKLRDGVKNCYHHSLTQVFELIILPAKGLSHEGVKQSDEEFIMGFNMLEQAGWSDKRDVKNMTFNQIARVSALLESMMSKLLGRFEPQVFLHHHMS